MLDHRPPPTLSLPIQWIAAWHCNFVHSPSTSAHSDMLSHIHFFSTLRELHTLDFVYSRTTILGYENDGDIIRR